jgi:hypothetical protein
LSPPFINFPKLGAFLPPITITPTPIYPWQGNLETTWMKQIFFQTAQGLSLTELGLKSKRPTVRIVEIYWIVK